MFWVAGMILEAWDIELEWVHSFAIILSENDTVKIDMHENGLDAHNDNEAMQEESTPKEEENSLEAIIAKRLGKGEGWNALKQTLKDRKVDILEMVSKHELCIRTL